MSKNDFSYRCIRLLLVLFFISWHTSVLHAQNSEFDELFKEARQQQYNNPNKSLDLYKYLLKTDLDKTSKFSVYIEQLHTYHILGQYVQMVEILQQLEESVFNITNKELLFAFWLEKACLYQSLNFTNEAKNSWLQVKKLFEELSSVQKDKNRKILEYIEFTFENSDEKMDRIRELKTIQSFWKEDKTRYEWFTYRLGEQYFEVDRDSSIYYFKTLATSQNQLLSLIAESHIKVLENEARNGFHGFDSVIEDEELSFTLKISFLERMIHCFQDHSKQEELMFFTDVLERIKIEEAALKRQAKSLLLEGVYYNKRESEMLQTQRNKERQKLVAIGLSIFILGYLFYAFYRRKRKVTQTEKKAARELTKNNIIPNKTEEEILRRLKAFENSTLYLDKQLRLARLAKHLKTNTRYLSVILNEKKKKSFNSYINQLRIAYIIDKLHNEPIYLSYKISYLAKESGFASQSSFSSSFKEVTGMPPSTYIKSITNKKAE